MTGVQITMGHKY